MKPKICVECLGCRHRAVIDDERLRETGRSSDVSIAELSRSLVCRMCGSRAVLVFRAYGREAQKFLQDGRR